MVCFYVRRFLQLRIFLSMFLLLKRSSERHLMACLILFLHPSSNKIYTFHLIFVQSEQILAVGFLQLAPHDRIHCYWLIPILNELNVEIKKSQLVLISYLFFFLLCHKTTRLLSLCLLYGDGYCLETVFASLLTRNTLLC